MAHNTKQQGSAIIVALFVVALVTIAATVMLTRLQQDTRRTELLLNTNQANLYAAGSITWAADQLINNLKLQQPQQLIDKTPIQSPANTMGNATIQSTIYDAQSFFNLNNLTDTHYQENFGRLIKAVMPKMQADAIQNIVQATVAWISAAPSTSALDEYYATLKPSYRSPRHPMASVSELRLVKGMTPELYTALLPYIIALPATTTLSINNAAAPVFMSLSPSLSAESAKAIEAQAKQSPFPSTQAFLNFDVVKNNNFPEDKITTTSSYFLVKTQVTIGDQTLILYTLLQRDLKNSQPSITLLWQSKGTL